MKTLRQRYYDALLKLGYRRVEGRTAKYWTMTHDDKKGYLFLGKSGALRSGRCSTASYPVVPSFKRMLLDTEVNAGEEIRGFPTDERGYQWVACGGGGHWEHN